MTSTEQNRSLPLVGVPTCRHNIEGLDYDCTQHKYLAALYRSAGVLPVQLPLFGEALDADQILAPLDGLLLTGSHSNIHPRYYESGAGDPDFRTDETRDGTVLRLIGPALEKGIPLFAICRGFQELNVALGGSLYPHVQDAGGYFDHREDPGLVIDQRYAEAHRVTLEPGGVLEGLLKTDSVMVNSLHEQGVKRPGDGLVVEGKSEDGLIEAVSARGGKGFTIGVQWHPEWQSTQNPVSTILFKEFGRACAEFARARGRELQH